MPAQAAVEQAQANAKDHAHDVRDPVVKVGAAVKAGLDELDGAPEGRRADEDGDQPNAACTRQWKGQSCEGHEVYKFVGAIRRWERLMDGPEHSHCQNSCDNQCEGDIEILAHANRV